MEELARTLGKGLSTAQNYPGPYMFFRSGMEKEILVVSNFNPHEITPLSRESFPALRSSRSVFQSNPPKKRKMSSAQ
jgi:hypothetical protein